MNLKFKMFNEQCSIFNDQVTYEPPTLGDAIAKNHRLLTIFQRANLRHLSLANKYRINFCRKRYSGGRIMFCRRLKKAMFSEHCFVFCFWGEICFLPFYFSADFDKNHGLRWKILFYHCVIF
ncbi:MAG: hypothetical protein KIS77_17925 [Saprospiraceae bacterium]|nr:hypothetical protein [Saprospiraceae bacterium]